MSALLLLKAAPLALSLASLWLLFKEVLLAHDGEEVGTGLAQLQRIETPMGRADWAAAYAETLCFRRPDAYSLPEARAYVQRGLLTPADCKLALENEFGSLAAFQAMVDRQHGDFIRRASPATLHRRRRWLLLGAALGAAALLLQGWVTWVERAGVERQRTEKQTNEEADRDGGEGVGNDRPRCHGLFCGQPARRSCSIPHSGPSRTPLMAERST